MSEAERMYRFERQAGKMLEDIMDRLRYDFLEHDIDEVYIAINAEGAGGGVHRSYSSSVSADLADRPGEGADMSGHPSTMTDEQLRDVSMLRPKT